MVNKKECRLYSFLSLLLAAKFKRKDWRKELAPCKVQTRDLRICPLSGVHVAHDLTPIRIRIGLMIHEYTMNDAPKNQRITKPAVSRSLFMLDIPVKHSSNKVAQPWNINLLPTPIAVFRLTPQVSTHFNHRELLG